MPQIVLAGIIAIIVGIVGCAIYIPKMVTDINNRDYKQGFWNAVRSSLFLLVFLLGIGMVPYY